MYIYKKKKWRSSAVALPLIFSPRQKAEEREVTPAAEWQWPSCIASLKWREGGRRAGGREEGGAGG